MPEPAAGTDVTIRTVMVDAKKLFGQDMILINKQGGNGVVALKYMEQQPGDGYQIMSMTASHLAAIITGKVNTKLKDITCLARLTDDPQFFVAKKGKYDSADAMLKDIQSRPIKIGGAQVGGTDHLAVAAFARQLEGLKYTYVPFKGAPEIAAGLVKGDIDLGMGNFSEMEPMIQANDIATVMVLSDERLKAQPDTPTAKEKGNRRSFLVVPGDRHPQQGPGLSPEDPVRRPREGHEGRGLHQVPEVHRPRCQRHVGPRRLQQAARPHVFRHQGSPENPRVPEVGPADREDGA